MKKLYLTFLISFGLLSTSALADVGSTNSGFLGQYLGTGAGKFDLMFIDQKKDNLLEPYDAVLVQKTTFGTSPQLKLNGQSLSFVSFRDLQSMAKDNIVNKDTIQNQNLQIVTPTSTDLSTFKSAPVPASQIINEIDLPNNSSTDTNTIGTTNNSTNIDNNVTTTSNFSSSNNTTNNISYGTDQATVKETDGSNVTLKSATIQAPNGGISIDGKIATPTQ